MNVFVKSIRKLMGWCPNAKKLETECWISPPDFEVNDRSGREKAGSQGFLSRFSRFFSRLDVRLFLPTLFLTPLYINMLFRKGINSESFFLGILLSLLIYSLCWKKQIQWYDALVKKPIVRYVSKMVLCWVFLSMIMFLAFPPIVFLSYMPSSFNTQSLYSFVAGPWILIMWGICLQLIYWEKKNHMKIYIKSENGFQKTYALGEKAREL